MNDDTMDELAVDLSALDPTRDAARFNDIASAVAREAMERAILRRSAPQDDAVGSAPQDDAVSSAPRDDALGSALQDDSLGSAPHDVPARFAPHADAKPHVLDDENVFDRLARWWPSTLIAAGLILAVALPVLTRTPPASSHASAMDVLGIPRELTEVLHSSQTPSLSDLHAALLNSGQ